MNLCNIWVWAVAAVATVAQVAARSADGLAVGRTTTMTPARLASTTLATTYGAVALLLQLRGGSSTAAEAAAAEAASSSSTRSSTFRMPSDLIQLSIEYSSGTGTIDSGALRATWMAQELLTAFSHEPALQAITLVPQKRTAAEESHGQTFRILLYEGTMFGAMGSGDGAMSVEINPPPVVQDPESLPEGVVVLWDQGDNQSGTFPELASILKLVRERVDQIEARLRQQAIEEAAAAAAAAHQPKMTVAIDDIAEGSSDTPDRVDVYSDEEATIENHVVISYTPTSYQCLWRAAYMALQLFDNAVATAADRKDSMDSYAVGTMTMVTLMPSRHSFNADGVLLNEEDVDPNGEGYFQVNLQQPVIADIWDRQHENKLLGQGIPGTVRGPNIVMYPEVADIVDRIARLHREQARIERRHRELARIERGEEI